MSPGVYRAGPWPGLTPRGAAVLLACAVLLGLGQVLIGPTNAAWPDLPVLGLTAFVPLAIATRLTQIPGAAAAVCGAYLLPRTLISLVEPSIEPPPLLLVPAIAYDLGLWLRPGHLAGVAQVWPARGGAWRRRPNRERRRIGGWRAAGAGALFGLALALVEPPFAILLGDDPNDWVGTTLWAAVAGCVGICALLGLSVRGTES